MFEYNRGDFDISVAKGSCSKWQVCGRKSLVKNELINVFGKICFFTEISNTAETDSTNQNVATNILGIEHFIPRNKDNINNIYDFDWNNLFLAHNQWNHKKGKDVDSNQLINESVYSDWLIWVNDPKKYFSYKNEVNYIKLIPNPNLDFDMSIKVIDFINKMKLNSFSENGARELAERRFYAFNLNLNERNNFPSMFEFFSKNLHN